MNSVKKINFIILKSQNRNLFAFCDLPNQHDEYSHSITFSPWSWLTYYTINSTKPERFFPFWHGRYSWRSFWGWCLNLTRSIQKGFLLLIIQTINSIYPLASNLYNTVSKGSMFNCFSNTFFFALTLKYQFSQSCRYDFELIIGRFCLSLSSMFFHDINKNSQSRSRVHQRILLKILKN